MAEPANSPFFIEMIRKLLVTCGLFWALASCKPEGGCRSPIMEAGRQAAAGDYAAAMSLASETLEQDPDSATASRACLLIAECHRRAGNHDAALLFTQKAADFSPNAHRDLVSAAVMANRPELAMSVLDRMPPADSVQRVEWLRLFVAPALATNRRDEAIGALRELYADSAWLTMEQSAILARDFLERGLTDSADVVVSAAAQSMVNGPHDLLALADFLKARGKSEEAFGTLRKTVMMQDSLLDASAAADIYNRLYDIEHQRHVDEMNRDRRATYALLALSLSALIVVLILMYFQRSISRSKLLEAENRLLLASNELRNAGEQRRSTLGRLFRGSFESIEMAANLLLDGAAMSKVTKELTARVESCRTPEFMSRLEQAVNECYNNVITRMRSELSLSEADISTALFCAAGLSPRVVCLLLNCTASALYNKKYRLKRKILNAHLSEEVRREYLSIIS